MLIYEFSVYIFFFGSTTAVETYSFAKHFP